MNLDLAQLSPAASGALSALCLATTIALYLAAKRLYAKRPSLLFSPLVMVPALLVAAIALSGIPYAVYFHDTRWLMWLLGPATIAFAVPIHEYRHLIRRHWLSLSVGVTVGIVAAVGGSLLLARLLHLSPELQRSLAVRSISTPFALAVSDRLHAPRDLTALFVIATGLCGMLLGELMLAVLPLRSRLARGALFGAAAHAVGTAKAREIGGEEGVVSSLTMMIAGVAMVLLAPLLAHLPV
ncbi:LrgB family protein [Burkholderia gladioli]|jgi:putative effector of murein hydrolase|uniref:LrgB family protein n=1 Tax=Burkholderia gladioli TaxID=28095 RepID=UPI000649587D|nr:LrgB family protein [Burkholderia gladioli]KAF1063625.1 Inner membrane protein YohK [Burkholderia gladioli]MBU9176036.1 LrgB family protein [Burkholderia gladioli]NRF89020.1 LrgB family protein [Burkholderia gladioli]PRH36634.1 LrgB family protein [Burkholderia gladioli]WAG19826.1 LrgB family protein [Burkholderia gladioli]